MQTIYKIGILIIILIFINHLYPLKNHFDLNNLKDYFNKTSNNIKLINLIYKHNNNLIVKNIDYDELINYKWNIKPIPINYIIKKNIIDYISYIYNNSKINSKNIEIINNVNYYNSYKGNYIPNIIFEIIIKNNKEEYKFIMETELFLHNQRHTQATPSRVNPYATDYNSNKIDIINLKINNIINPNEPINQKEDSIFLNIPMNENYSEDSLIPTINNISE